MIVKITGAATEGVVNAIPSKSYAHRICICNFLSGNGPKSGASGVLSNDIIATEDCLARVTCGNTALDCGESGSTLRFLLPLLSALGGEYTLSGHGKLMQRPNDELFKVLRERGVTIEKTETITLKGKLTAGEFKLRGDISSQYISGLLMALPILDGDSKIVLTTPLQSAPYIDITLEVLSAYGVKIEKRDYGYFVKGNQKYSGAILPEGDWSNAAFFLVLGATSGNITVNGLNLASVQGDRKIIDILDRAGVSVVETSDGLTVKKSSVKSFEFDFSDCPDLVPISAVLAAFANGKSVLKNIERLRIKESDRIKAIKEMINSIGGQVEEKSDGLIIKESKLKGGTVDGFNDHRIVMSACVSSLVTENAVTVLGANAVDKSYPQFFEIIKELGFTAEEI